MGRGGHQGSPESGSAFFLFKKGGMIGAVAPILTSQRTARLCAAILDRRQQVQNWVGRSADADVRYQSLPPVARRPTGASSFKRMTIATSFRRSENRFWDPEDGSTWLTGRSSARKWWRKCHWPGYTFFVVPEPSTWTMALAGLACGRSMLRRQKPASGPRLSSLS
jgi:hypothetical protein